MSKERHAHEDALNETEFDELLDGAGTLTPPQNLEATFIIHLSGKLGMRIGEIAHLRRSWVDLEQGLIEVPSHEPCEKGRDGGLCGYCRRQANRTYENDPENRDLDELLDSYWQPKTTAAERAVPYTFDDETREHRSSVLRLLRRRPLLGEHGAAAAGSGRSGSPSGWPSGSGAVRPRGRPSPDRRATALRAGGPCRRAA